MAIPRINKVLIANRGEIALRIKRACDKLGIGHVMIASEADKDGLFAREASELIVIGPPPAKDSYLAIDKILRAAIESGCNAVHPGYGFLSENAEFARRVIEAGLIFIGPQPESIEILGSKTLAREKVQFEGVPIVPGAPGDLSDKELIKRAETVGFPVIIKAVAGGGGRGMRVVNSGTEMKEALPRARAEALKNFSDEAIFFERYIRNPRHVEVQVFGDSHGNLVHFGTRDCSVQRRHQKLIEEAPAPNLPDTLRESIHNAAIGAARSVQYQNAGTAEFLVSGDEFFFLEMNTRIQVEHPVTEAVTGVDLVELQIRVAQGEPLPMKQEEIHFKGHAIEFRIYAEDPASGFSPTKGTIHKIHRPTEDGVREDFGYEAGDTVSLFYDAMLSKVIVHAETRAEAIRKSYEYLKRYSIRGFTTNIEFHRWMLLNPIFKKVQHDIGFIEREFNNTSILELTAREVHDPKHRPPVAGAQQKDIFMFRSEAHNTQYSIEVTHLKSGEFLAIPIDSKGRKGKNSSCRRSNGMEAALHSVIEDVLIPLSPSEIFQE